MDKKPTRFEGLLGMIVVAELLTGLAALFGAVVAFFNAEWTGAGLCLTASALAFGLLANAFLRN